MKKILHLGCSWSEISPFRDNQSSPITLLNSLLKEKDKDFKIYSTASGGSSIGMQIDLLLQILDTDLKFDAIIFQSTTLGRGYSRNLLDFTPVSEKDFIEFTPKYPSSTVYTLRDYEYKNYHWYSTQSIVPKRHSITGKNLNTFFVFKNRIQYDENSEFFGQVLLAKKILENSKIPFIMYGHQIIDAQRSGFPLRCYDDIRKEFDFVSAEEFDINPYCIDDGHHLSLQGNLKVAEILLPLALDRFTS